MSDEFIAPRDPSRAVDWMIQNSAKYAQAKADRVYIEGFLKSKKSLLMKTSGETAVAAQEREAYSHPEYIALLDGLKAAVEAEETLRWGLVAAQARVEIWRTESANNRAMDKAAA